MKKDHISSLPEDIDLLYRFLSSRCVAPLLGCQSFCGCSSNYSKGPVFWMSPQSLLFLYACFVFRGFTEHPSTHVHTPTCTHLSFINTGGSPPIFTSYTSASYCTSSVLSPLWFWNSTLKSQHTRSPSFNWGLDRHVSLATSPPHLSSSQFVSHFSLTLPPFSSLSLPCFNFCLLPSITPPPLQRACPLYSGLLSGSADWAPAAGGPCVDKSKSTLTNDMCRMCWRHWDRVRRGKQKCLHTNTGWWCPLALAKRWDNFTPPEYLWELSRAAS